MLYQVNNDQGSIQRLQEQLSTGYRFLLPSEDPSSAIKVLSAQRQLEFRKQTEVNLKHADSTLSVTETNLSEAQTLLNSIRALAVEGAGNTLSNDQRTSLLNQIDGTLKRMADLANSKFGDQYIFAGSNVRSDPLRLDNDVVQFLANDEQLQSISDYNTLVTSNVTAQEAFGVRSNQIVGTVDLSPSIDLDTPLSILNQGSGINKGVLKLSSGTEAKEVDFSNVYNVGEALNLLNGVSLSGRQVIATLSANGIDIDYADGQGGLLRVEDINSGSTAKGLGINNEQSGSQSPVVGADLKPLMTPTTKISQLFDGTGIANALSFKLFQGGKSYVINTNGIDTVEDLLNRIEGSGARVSASIDTTGRYLTIQSTESGSQFSIGENGGTLATDLGLRTMIRDTPLSRLNNGQGIFLNPNGEDLLMTRNDGTNFTVGLSGSLTVGDVIDRINNNVNNFSVTTRITASLSTDGNGVVLTSSAGTQAIAVSNAGGSQAATGLGWTTKNSVVATGTNSATQSVITGRDVSGVEVEGAFTSIIKLRRAIANQEYESLQQIGVSLDQDLERISIARGFVGARQQDITSRIEKSEDEGTQLTQIESDHHDVDLASVISDLTQRQAALTASLQFLGQSSRNTLFNYL
jgi:flagellar hook-associated protein 3 FlgL